MSLQVNAEYLAAAELDVSQSRNPKSSKEKKKCSQFKGDLWICIFLFFDFYYQTLEVKVKENLQYVCAFSFA